jgi:hypothetical protein
MASQALFAFEMELVSCNETRRHVKSKSNCICLRCDGGRFEAGDDTYRQSEPPFKYMKLVFSFCGPAEG